MAKRKVKISGLPIASTISIGNIFETVENPNTVDAVNKRASGQTIVDLVNNTNLSFIDIGQQWLKDSNGFVSVDWGTGTGSKRLRDTAGLNSVLWAQRALMNSLGAGTVDWENNRLFGNWTQDGAPLSVVLSGGSSPEGAITPNHIGQLFVNISPPFELYFSTGVTVDDWIRLYPPA